MHFLIHIIERAVIYDVIFRLMRHLTLPEAVGLAVVVGWIAFVGSRRMRVRRF